MTDSNDDASNSESDYRETGRCHANDGKPDLLGTRVQVVWGNVSTGADGRRGSSRAAVAALLAVA